VVTHLHDPAGGGFWSWAERGGERIVDPDRRDHLGLAPTTKSLNVQGDLLEAVTTLQHLQPRGTTVEVLRELSAVVRRWPEADGTMPVARSGDLQTAVGPASAGYALQASYRVPLAAAVDGSGDLRTDGWDGAVRRWGAGQVDRRGFVVTDQGPQWWMQFELVRSAVFRSALRPDDERDGDLRLVARDHLARTEARFGDPRHHGFSVLPRRRWRRGGPKGDGWKDASHEAFCYRVAAVLMAAGDAPPSLEVLVLP
jgi:hypothetical protein